jgi:hypothetical protein
VRVLSRDALGRWTAANGIDREEMTWRDGPAPFRMLLRDATTIVGPTVAGPHRRLNLPGEDKVEKIPLGDRPALSRFVAAAFREAGAPEVCAFGAPESYWLNNRGYAAYLSRVADARRVHLFLRRAGLTDRFRGGFRIQPFEYDSHLPALAAQPFCGGPDVMFASAAPPLLILACHEFDLHVEARREALANGVAEIAADAGLRVLRSNLNPDPQHEPEN